MENIKQLALVALLSCGFAQADVSLNVDVKKGEDYHQNFELVVSAENGETVSVEGRDVKISATPVEEDSVIIALVLEGHDSVFEKTVKWGEKAEFSCEESGCCLTVVAAIEE